MKKRIYSMIFIICICLICITMNACSNKIVTSITIDSTTIPSEINITQVDLNVIKLNVIYNDGETKRVSLNSSMLSKEDNDKLQTIGTHTISVRYKGNMTTLTLNIVELDHLHTLTKVNAKEPTCTVEGNREYWTCTCGKIYSDSLGNNEIQISTTIINKKEHSYDNECDSMCNVCSTIRQIAHQLEKREEIPATCTKQGMLAHQECLICHEKLINNIKKTDEELIIPVTDHSYSFNWSQDKNYHWHECICGNKQNYDNHQYDNDDDFICNICSYDRNIYFLSVVIKKAPTKVEYFVGEHFNPEGMVLTITYKDGSTKDINVIDDPAITYKTEKLTLSDTTIKLTIGTTTIEQKITFHGVCLEAEEAILNSSSVEIKNDSVDATNQKYVGNMISQDTISFEFIADKAGTSNAYFRLASQYLKQDINWTPVLMGDCQLNKIAMFYVNNIVYPIDDSVILHGSGVANGNPDYNLWFKWEEILFENVNLIKGKNVLQLKFISHNYNDCSQASLNNRFTANIDNMKIVTDDISISKIQFTVDNVNLKVIENKPYYVISGNINGYVKEDLILDFQQNNTWMLLNGDNIDYTIIIDMKNATYQCLFDMTQLKTDANNTWYPHFKLISDTGNGDIKANDIAYLDGQSITLNEYVYTSYTDAFACAGVRRTNDPSIYIGSTYQIGSGSYATKIKGDSSCLSGLPYRSKEGNVYITENMTGPIPTSDWATSFLWGNSGNNPYSNPGFAIPLVYQATSSGMLVTNPSTIIDNINNTYLMGISPTDLLIKPLGFSPSCSYVDKVTDWTYDIVMSDDDMQMKTIMTQGSPYAFFEFLNTGVEIDIIRGLPTKIVYGNCNTNQIVLQIYDNQDGDYNYYGLYAPEGTTWDFVYTTRFGNSDDIEKIIINFPTLESTYMSLSMLPNGEIDTIELFKNYAYNFITDTKTSWIYDNETAQIVTTYNIITNNKAESSTEGTIIGVLPHQYKNMNNDNYLSDTYETIRGKMKLLIGNSYTTKLQYTGIIPYLPNSISTTSTLQTYLYEYVNQYEDANPTYLGTGVSDTYWGGKGLNRLVNILPIAEQLGETKIATEMLEALKKELEDWFSTSDTEQNKYFYYDKEIGTLIGFPASFGSDTEINDHHFHYGYLIMAAAQVALRDPQWASDENWGGMVKELIGDIACTDRNSDKYPYLRNFSPFEGHSWASGHGTFGDGNNQESSSEALNAWAGIILFGEATENTELRDLGIYLYTTEISAIENYWFDIDKDVLAPAYRYDDVNATEYDENREEIRNQSSMIWGGKYIYGTWWTAEPLQIQGINLLPLTGASLYLAKNKDYILNNYLLAREKEDLYMGSDKLTNPYDRWNDIWHIYLSMSNPDLALENWNSSAAVEGGESKAHTYNFMKVMQDYGTPDTTITSNCVLSAVFNKNGIKTYTVFNTSAVTKEVCFSDGTTVLVQAHAFYCDEKA